MKLDFNETNILVQAINDLDKYKRPVNKTSLIEFLYYMAQNTDKKYVFIQQSIKSLISMLEALSEESIAKIHKDVLNDNVIAMSSYKLPNI